MRKFIYSPGVDEPICLIDIAGTDARYYLLPLWRPGVRCGSLWY